MHNGLSRRDVLKALGLGAVAISLPRGLMAAGATTRVKAPNIVIILADDLGYECLGANGGTSYKTPNLDKLAAGGVRFDSCHVQPLCTPTRVQVMTGIYNVRNYVSFGHMDPEQTTFANILKKADYATCMVGKWQLGSDPKLPAKYGFDEYCLWQHLRSPGKAPRYPNPGLEVNGKIVDYTNGEYGPDVINKYAMDFITRKKDGPFFLYYADLLPHFPFQATPDSEDWDPRIRGEKAATSKKYFPDMIAYMDKMAGRLIDKLEDLKLRENTLVIFVGDNGSDGIVSKMGDRTVIGQKSKAVETGMHVPMIASWPGVIEAKRVCHDLVDSTDFLPTICQAAGAAVPEELKIDGQSFLPQLRGEKGNPRQWYYCWYSQSGAATTKEEFAANHDYKLYRDGRFFDLKRDLEEKNPLDVSTLDSQAVEVQKVLQLALDKYKNARPARFASSRKAATQKSAG